MCQHDYDYHYDDDLSGPAKEEPDCYACNDAGCHDCGDCGENCAACAAEDAETAKDPLRKHHAHVPLGDVADYDFDPPF